MNTNRFWSLVLLTVVVTSSWNVCVAQTNQFDSKQDLFEDAVEDLETLSTWAQAAEVIAKANKVEANGLPPGEREDVLLRIEIIDESMDSIEDHVLDAISALNWVKGTHLTTINEANSMNVGASDYQPLPALDRVYFAEQAALIEYEVRAVEQAIDAILPLIVASQIAAAHPVLEDVLAPLLLVEAAYTAAKIKAEDAVAHARDETGMIAALTLVNFMATKPVGYFDTQYPGYDRFQDARIHAGFDLQSFKLTMDDQANATFSGGRYYRGYQLGYEIPVGTVLQSDLRARRLGHREVIAYAGSKIYAAPGYDKTPANVSIFPEKNRIDVNNIGIAMHMRPDDQPDPNNEIFIVAYGNPISAGEQVLYPVENVDVTWEPGDTDPKIEIGFTVFVTGGNRFIAGASENDPDFYQFHITVDATKLAPTDPCWVWDPILELYYDTCGGPPIIN